MTKDTGKPDVLKSKPDIEKKDVTILGGPKRPGKPEIMKQGRRGG